MSWNNRLNKKGTIRIFLFTTLVFVVGCSTYTPQSQVIAKENLATYNPKNFANKQSNALATHKRVKSEDEWIVKAIWYEQINDFKKSNFYYKKLYEATNRDEYLLKELKTALYSGITSGNITKLEEYISSHPNSVIARRLLLSSYLYEKKYEKAKESAKKLLEKSTQAVDFELSANPYIFTKKYDKAIEFLSNAYNKTYNEDILLKITTILVNYLGNISEAVNRLEKHRISQGCSKKICLQLINIYSQQGNAFKLLPVYQSLFKSTSEELYGEKIVETHLYLKDFKSAIQFLKTDYKNDELLYSLYISQKNYNKADKLSRKLIIETRDPKWYAESAMTLYESSSNKNDVEMLSEVVRRFEKALKQGVKNTVYLNYYGYTLIDKNIDVNKGINIIKKALEEQPDNSYYMDSLAWGYYKLNHCEEALSIMNRVIAIEGLSEPELREHSEAINKKCKKENSGTDIR